ncbi:bifunctional 4-hydroxy-2-oxoglutarate aldolase/2-dehydro-3-deoxy-phosphogluconate aldolase [Salinispira pacifica]|uniref:2-dehydro-3-deoxy-phosphogluconate aldolase n=1 Tax=Salinispira pacifica TaxID=1307761 RepID=V5WET6_9SPIO|nr:bifunctional 4-hydroxy-2-oxoglutarate aldolase/2-dehydro-3-deoxy-phosphogluconate aldolase [Salinispira pacifica]AHC13681.1 4-Hydroxy-2-oxoglutarate aldolase/ 2-dehydro-3-deoxyphosphogluconate aldolase [Salinispira pacifica]
MSLFEKIAEYRIIPVLNLPEPQPAIRLAQLFLEEGLPVMEITFRNSGASQVIRAVRERFPEMLLGAGTVRQPEQLDDALEAGVDFLVSPSLVPGVIRSWDAMRSNGAAPPPYIPGIATVREAEEALEYGLTLLKFFPASVSGGPGMLKAIKATHPELKFIPTGGINLENLSDYLKLPNVTACGASSVFNRSAFESGDIEAVRERIRDFLTVRGISLPE